MNQTPKFVPTQYVTVKVGHRLVCVQVVKVRWSKSGKEYRYVVRDLFGRRVDDIPERVMRNMRSPGEKATLEEIGTITHVENDEGKDVEALQLADGTLITL